MQHKQRLVCPKGSGAKHKDTSRYWTSQWQEWMSGLCFNTFSHIRRSSLGNGRGRLGFSVPAAPVCFLSSALGLYVPSILRFFLMRHISSSRVRLSSDSTADANTDTDGACNAMVTARRWGSQGGGSPTCVTTASLVRYILLSFLLQIKSITQSLSQCTVAVNMHDIILNDINIVVLRCNWKKNWCSYWLVPDYN